MKKVALLLALTALILTGCAQTAQAPEPVEESVETPTPTPTPTPSPTPTETPTPTPTEEPEEYFLEHFDALNIDLPFPGWVKDWPIPGIDQDAGYINYEDEEGEIVEIFANYIDDDIDGRTGEPVVYNEWFFDDADPEDIVDWSDEDGLFKINALTYGYDTMISVYRTEEYKITCKLFCTHENVDKYEKAFDYLSEAAKSTKPGIQEINKKADPIGKWYTEGYDELENWACSYQINLTDDGKATCVGWRNKDSGTYEVKGDNKVLITFDKCETDSPGEGWVPVHGYKYTIDMTINGDVAEIKINAPDVISNLSDGKVQRK